MLFMFYNHVVLTVGEFFALFRRIVKSVFTHDMKGWFGL